MEWIVSILPTVLVSIFLFYFERKQKKRDEAETKRTKARKQETLLSLEMQMASNKLSYATAMALKRGHANGEVEEGIEAYESAKKKYFAFLNMQSIEYLNT